MNSVSIEILRAPYRSVLMLKDSVEVGCGRNAENIYHA